MPPQDYTMEQFRKLPKWTQSELNYRNMRIRELEERLTKVTESKADSRVQSSPYDDHPFGLPEDQSVSFQLGADRNFDKVSVRLDKNSWEDDYHLVVMGGTVLAIRPQSSNSVNIRLEKS